MRTTKSALLSEAERERGLITASAGRPLPRALPTLQNSLALRLPVVMPTVTPLNESEQNQRTMGQTWFYMGMYTMMPASMLLNLASKQKVIHLFHPFDDLDVAAGQGSNCHGNLSRNFQQLTVFWFQ